MMMFYLFTQTFFWLLSAFIVGFVMAWWLRGKTDVSVTASDDKQLSVQQAAVPSMVAVSGHGQQAVPDVWAPTGLSSSPVDGKDDLKLIKGIGPKLEQRLNNLGLYRYSQLASLSTNDIAWVKDKLTFSMKLPVEQWALSAVEKLASQQAEGKQET
jgi:predicted flap endonuclease-1-like 5' DNA nuclease